MYPNPASQVVQVQLTLEREQYLSLDWYDVTGRRLNKNEQFELGVGTHNLTLDIHDLTEGVYFLRIGGEAEGQSIRVVVSR